MGVEERHRQARMKDPNYVPFSSWSYEIQRLAKESQQLISKLPKNIKHQYNVYRAIIGLLEKARGFLYDGKIEEAEKCWANVKKLKCCNEGDCGE